MVKKDCDQILTDNQNLDKAVSCPSYYGFLIYVCTLPQLKRYMDKYFALSKPITGEPSGHMPSHPSTGAAVLH